MGFRQFKDGEGMSGISSLRAVTLTCAIPSPNCKVLGALISSPGETSPKGARLAGMQNMGCAGGSVLLTMEAWDLLSLGQDKGRCPGKRVPHPCTIHQKQPGNHALALGTPRSGVFKQA